MLSAKAISDADYHLRGDSGCGGGKEPGGSAAEYELDAVLKGEPPGEWLYPHRNDFGMTGQIHPEGESGDGFRRAVNHLQHPVTGEQLGRAPMHFASLQERMAKFDRQHPDATVEQRQAEERRAQSKQRHANHAWDFTFSVVKSISVAWAALEHEAHRLEDEGDHEAAEQYQEQAREVVACLREAADAAMKMVADEHGFTRRGSAGPQVAGQTTMRHVRDQNLQCAIFVHHTSRERDPQLHAHVVTLNRVLSEDGQWRALYSPAMLKNKHGVDAVFQRTLEAGLTQRLGWRFATRPDGKAREVVGVSPEVRDLFSARTRAVDSITEEDLVDWRKVHGDDPPALIKWRIQRRAVLKTRRGKPKDAPTREQDVARWDQEIAKEFREGLAAVLEEVDMASTQPGPDPDFDPDVVIAMALADLTQRKATWNRSHLMHAISQHLPDMLQVEPARVPALLTELTDAAIEGRQVVSLVAPAPVPVPAALKDEKTGESVFEAPNGGRYTTRVHLGREDSLVNRLDRRGAPVLTDATARDALEGHGLSDEQMAVALGIFTSDRAVEVVDAPAGTGKSRLMAALSDTSAEVWGHGLTGFAVAQNAAQVLAREGVARAHNIAAYLDFRKRERNGQVSDLERATFAVPRGGTVVVDEASMVSTPQLAELFAELDQAGVGKTVLIGDTAQVDAVDAGGGFRLLTQERDPYTLTQVRRFAEEWEKEASRRLRDGDLDALTQYDVRGRIRGGEPEDVDRRIVDDFIDDFRSGLETVVVVSTGDKAAELSSEIRQRLVRDGRVEERGVPLHDATVAGVGDIVQTRWNNRTVGVVNREVWRVTAIDDDGHVTVRPALRDEHDQLTWGEEKHLPSHYVKDHVELAYAATVEAVQGRSVDTGHVLVDPMMGASRLYPAQTRGRLRNTAWVSITPPVRRLHESDAEYEARIPSAMSQMIAAYEREDHTEAARTVIAAEQERATHLGHLGPQWAQLVAEHRAADHRQVLREVVGTDQQALFADPALEGVLHLMRSAESHGYDVREAVTAAYGGHRLEGARTPAALLYDFLDKHLSSPATRPQREVTPAESYVERTPAGDDPEITYAREIAAVEDARVADLGEQATVEPPQWALALLGAVPVDPLERAEWSEKVGVVAGYRERHGLTNAIDPIGRAPSKAEPEKLWEWQRATRALGVDAEREVVAAEDGELANRVLAWRRTQDAVPRNVDDDRREIEEDARLARRNVADVRARGGNPAEAVRELQAIEARIARLEQVATGRRAVVASPEFVDKRDRAQEAMVEMQRRVDRDRAVMEREEARHAADERDAREAAEREADAEARVHEAVGERFLSQWVPDAPVLGAPRWAELDDADPKKRAGLFNAALSWWRAGNPRDEHELTDRLEQHGADVAPEHALTARGVERVRGGEDEEQVRQTEPSGDLEVLADVHRYTAPELEGEAPEFGTPEYADADEPAMGKAETRAALRWFGAGDTLDERAERADRLDERASAAAISRDMAEQRHPFDERPHAEVVKARGEEPPEPAEPKHVEKPGPVRDEPVERAPEPVAEVKPQPVREEPEPVREEPEPVREEKPAPEPKQVEQREPEPEAEPERVDTSWVREAKEAAEREPETEPEPKRDDLAEQVQRAQAAVERMKADEAQREQTPAQRDPEPVRERDAAER